jgi:hypothetical protein
MSEKTDFFNKDFDALAEEALSFYHCPGLSIGITYKGKTYAKVWVPFHLLALTLPLSSTSQPLLTSLIGIWLL